MATDQDPQVDRLAAEPAQTPGADDLVDQLQRLAELREQGVLSDGEFTAEKQKILQS